MPRPKQPGIGADFEADLERRFGGLRRLYGDAGYAKLRAARFAIVGLGGVGSWAAEALARCGVAELVLIDLDHVAESNINRQVQALTPTLGQAKARALAERIALIHPGCRVHEVEEFATADNWPALLPVPVHGLIDACDQVRAKEALARWSLEGGVPIVVAGAAGGKQRAQDVQVADLLEVTHDPLLAALRQRLRKAARTGAASGAARPAKLSGICCVFSREAVALPLLAAEAAAGAAFEVACATTAGASAGASAGATAGASAGASARTAHGAAAGTADGTTDGSLNCHGYGSSVMVTATFGMVAASAAVAQLLGASSQRASNPSAASTLKR